MVYTRQLKCISEELEKYIQHGDLKYRGLESELSAAYIVDMMSTIRKLVKKDIYE